jgi:2-polyprenyl-3-methyl-5-hydroxy-6-metoxy-1,4-benzoquinol methylase
MKQALYQIKQWIRHMIVYPPLTLSRVDYDAYWKEKRGDNIGALSDWQIERADFVCEILKNAHNASLCDIACGDGSILNYIAKRVDTSKLIGTDISEFALNQARKFGVETVYLDISKPEEIGHIPEADYMLLFEILEHVPHSEELLKGAFNKAHKGVFFSFPNTGFFIHRFRLLFGRFPLQWKLFPGEHVRYWTKRDLLWWLRSLGYKHFVVRYYKGIPLLNKMWPSLCAAGFVVFIPKEE